MPGGLGGGSSGALQRASQHRGPEKNTTNSDPCKVQGCLGLRVQGSRVPGSLQGNAPETEIAVEVGRDISSVKPLQGTQS